MDGSALIVIVGVVVSSPLRARSKMNGAMDRDARTRARLEQHWSASERGDIDTEHAIYADDAILDYPQSRERFRGRSRIRAQRGGHAAERCSLSCASGVAATSG